MWVLNLPLFTSQQRSLPHAPIFTIDATLFGHNSKTIHISFVKHMYRLFCFPTARSVEQRRARLRHCFVFVLFIKLYLHIMFKAIRLVIVIGINLNALFKNLLLIFVM